MIVVIIIFVFFIIVNGDDDQCSTGCRDYDIEDFYCDSVCNNEACGYDGGDCVSKDSCYGFSSCHDCVSKDGCYFADDGNLMVGCASSSLMSGFFQNATQTTDCSTIQSNPSGAESLGLNDDRLIFQRYYPGFAGPPACQITDVTSHQLFNSSTPINPSTSTFNPSTHQPVHSTHHPINPSMNPHFDSTHQLINSRVLEFYSSIEYSILEF